MSEYTPRRGEICDKWHRYCIHCGTKMHVNVARDGGCPGCDEAPFGWTRDKGKVKA